jgi:molybdopterin/thiamine biosynthesis adenylyltransferase
MRNERPGIRRYGNRDGRPDARTRPVNSRRAFLRGIAGAAREAAAGAVAPAGEPRGGAALLSSAERDRYAEQLAVPGWSEEAQAALREASVLVIGAGALGSPVAAYLAGAGAGRLGIADGGDVALRGLHRQHLHFTPDAGVPKATSAAAKLRFLNPGIVVEPYHVRFEDANAAGLVAGHDLVVDCTGAAQVRHAANAACCGAGVALVTGWAGGGLMAVRPGETACLRCAFPEAPPGDAGAVLGPAAGVLGSLMALEALRLLAGAGEALADAYLEVDLAGHALRRVPVTRRPDCPDCATPTL